MLYPGSKTGAYTIPSSVTNISSLAFKDCIGLTGELVIPAGVTTIGSSAFQGCRGLTSINVDESNAGYSSVDGVLFNKAKTTLMLYPASKTGAYTIPSSVTSISNYAFWGCSGLTGELVISAGVNIGNYAFAGCSGLTSIKVDAIHASYSSVDGVLFNKAKTTLIQYAGKTGAYTIPNSVTDIGSYAFWGCEKLTSVTIPSSVNYTGYYTFEACSGLDKVVNFASTPQVTYVGYGNAFKDVDLANVKLYVLAASLEEYKAATGWSGFGKIIELTAKPTATTGLVHNGSEQTGVAANAAYTITGNKETNVGNYTATITLNENRLWEDGTNDVLTIEWSIKAADADPIKDFKKSDGRFGIMLSSNVVSDKVEMAVRLENNERIAQTKVVIYDAVGNVVFDATTREDRLAWNLTNGAGRAVANGTYLVTAQVRGVSGKTWGYSAKLGVRR
jgi:hypothetical protein